MLHRHPPRTRRGRYLALAMAVVLSSLGCFTKAPDAADAPSSAPAPAAAPAPAPPPPRTEALEEKAEGAPNRSTSAAAPSVGGAATTGGAARAPQKAAATKARARSVPRDARGAEPSPELRPSEAEPAPEEPQDLRHRLDRAYGAATPDCPSARDRKQAVCDLAAQICQLTDRDPNVANVAGYCDDARRRCSDAERRTLERCPR